MSPLRPLVVAAVLGVPACTPPPDPPRDPNDLPLLGTKPLAPLPKVAFTMPDTRGEPFDFRAETDGKVALLFFGYTYCPDVCPTTLQSLVSVEDRLGPEDDVRVVFVSVDPARDDVARMARYVAFFDPAYLGVTGDPEQLGVLTRAVGAYNAAQPPEPGAEGYLVDHASSLFLVGPDARLHAILDEPERADAFVDAVRRIQAIDRSS